MRHLSRVQMGVAVAVTLTAALVGTSRADAGGDRATGRGATFDVSAFISGFGNPAGMWENPCDADGDYHSDWMTGGGGARGATRVRADGVVEVLWKVSCEDDERGIYWVREYWVPIPDPAVFVPDVAALLPGYLDPPHVEWPNASPEHGWLFVKVPMDFRIDNLGPVTLTATVTNAAGSATATATATPSTVEFVSGERGGTECAFAAAQEEYVPGAPGSCSYEYQNSSAIAGGAFDTTVTVYWEITSDPPHASVTESEETSTAEALAVSEVQALVTCQGSGC